jgi:hypothetical protein
LASWLVTGSATDRGTDGTAARWTIASTPAAASARASRSRIEAARRSTSTPSRLAAGEVVEDADLGHPVRGGQVAGEVRADEAGAAGDEDPHDAAG